MYTEELYRITRIVRLHFVLVSIVRPQALAGVSYIYIYIHTYIDIYNVYRHI